MLKLVIGMVIEWTVKGGESLRRMQVADADAFALGGVLRYRFRSDWVSY